MLPSGDNIVFRNSAFFAQKKAPASLPSPSVVRVAASRLPADSTRPVLGPYAVPFESTNLLVKYGRTVTTSEGKCLWAIRSQMGDSCPVPEVYGWCHDGDEVFIYMELIRGDTLSSRWNDLSQQEKEGIAAQLKKIVRALRQFKLGPGEVNVGRIDGQPICDIIFTSSFTDPSSTFPNLRSFHDWFIRLPLVIVGRPDAEPNPMRADLPDDVPIAFTHNDLHRGNIMISPKGQYPARLIAIIDWHQSGWMPAYWEYCKAKFSVASEDEWCQYLPDIFHPYDQWNLAWLYTKRSLGV